MRKSKHDLFTWFLLIDDTGSSSLEGINPRLIRSTVKNSMILCLSNIHMIKGLMMLFIDKMQYSFYFKVELIVKILELINLIVFRKFTDSLIMIFFVNFRPSKLFDSIIKLK